MRVSVLLATLLLATALAGCSDKGGDSDSPSATSSSSTGPASSNSSSTSRSGTTTSSSMTTSANKAPVISDFATNRTGLKVDFAFAASDAEQDSLTFTLGFGDQTSDATGSLIAGQGNVTHTFAAAGQYNATLTVSDGKLSSNRTLALNITAAAAATGGAAQDFTCNVALGTAGFTLRGSPAGDLGYCSYTVLEDDSVLQAENNPSGCVTYFDETPTDTSGGAAATLGTTYAAGVELGMRCPLPGGAAGGDGTITVVAA